jgi:peptide/nickel transport system substrate-binding protein
MAQYAWTTSSQPPCYLYTSSQIPGPYPDYPKGWGGANATGYSSPEYDQACLKASFSLPDSPEYQDAQRKAQTIFAEDLPVIPLYLRMKMAVMRPDMCGAVLDPSASSSLWNLEAFNYGADCKK